jgi:endonuclease I
MKKARNYVGIAIILIGAVIYGSRILFGIDLVLLVVPDNTKPEINTTELRTSVTLNGSFDPSVVTCTDNYDNDCEVEISGSIDTSSVGSQSITFRATDSSGNTSVESVVIMIIEGIDTTMYVPAGYYDGISGLTGEALKNALNDIIRMNYLTSITTDTHFEAAYTDKDLDDMDVWKMLRDADEDPDNSENIILFYSGYSWPKECQDTNTDLLPDYCFINNDRDEDYTEWNREHIWSKSHGDFEDEDGYALEESFGGYALGAHTDGHHLVAAERAMNSTKNNRFFDDCHDGINDDNLVDREFGNYTCGDWYFEPRDEVKGDVARMLFYMATRYEGEDGDFVDLELTNNLYLYEALETAIQNSKLPYYENLEVLLRWHLEDPVDEWELERNESIYQIQGNRNPFIDHPEWVELIWGTPENPIEYESTTIIE